MAQGDVKRLKASELDLKEKVVDIKRVAKVNQGGRTFSFSAIVVVGDGEGIVGNGLGKAREVTEAISKGVDDAKKNLMQVPLINDTIPHEVFGKFGAGKVVIKPASAGTGIIAGGAMRAVLERAGINNVLCKSLGSANPHNVIKATLQGLGQLRDPLTVAKHRNIELKKVFNG